MRIIFRRERPHPGAQLSLFEQHEGHRFHVTATNLPTGQVPLLEACHRVQARVESRIRCGKDTGLRRLPSQKFAMNSVWCAAVGIACDLLAWLGLLALDGDLAKAEPKTIRYRLLHTAGRIIHGQRSPSRCPPGTSQGRRASRPPPQWWSCSPWS
nr:transposase [Frankia sp. Cas4]